MVINEKTQFVVIWFKTSAIPLDNSASAIIHYLCGGGSTGTRDFPGESNVVFGVL